MGKEFRRVKIRRDDLLGPGEFGSAGPLGRSRTVNLRGEKIQPPTADEALMSVVLGRPFPNDVEREGWWA